MVMERGLVPELAVTAVFPSGLSVRPYGWGATTILLPAGVRILPLGIMVSPSLWITAYRSPAGAEMIQGPFSDWLLQDTNTTSITAKIFFAFIAGILWNGLKIRKVYFRDLQGNNLHKQFLGEIRCNGNGSCQIDRNM
jgi:hypothetical protein